MFWLRLAFFVVVAAFRCALGENGVTLVGEKVDNYNVDLYCVATDFGKALAWETPIASQYKRPVANSLSQPLNFVEENWIKLQSYKQRFGPILDKRWEDLPIVLTTGLVNKFEEIGVVNSYQQAEFTFSVKLKQEGHLFICESEYEKPPDNNCYWILLGGWRGATSAIRKCTSGQIKWTNEAPRGACGDKRDSKDLNKISEDEWRHFTVSFDAVTKTVSVSFVGDPKPFMQFHDNRIWTSFRKIYVQSRVNHKGFWKFHNADFMYNTDNGGSTKILQIPHTSPQPYCISMFVVSCRTCQLRFQLQDALGNYIKHYEYLPSQDYKWRWINLYISSDATSTFLHLYLQFSGASNDGPFAAISNAEKYDCYIQSVRTSYLKVNVRDMKQTSCRLLEDESTKTSLKTISQSSYLETNCSLNSVGSKCIPCSRIFNSDYCEKKIICELGQEGESCYCPPGFSGDYCQETCSNGYGLNCSDTCGNCEFKPCHHITGNCAKDQCEENFAPPTCKEATRPVLKSGPQIRQPCYRTCTVSFDPSDYTGRKKPTWYFVQYALQKENTWTSLPATTIAQTTQILTGLDISSTYKVRIVLTTNDEEPYTGNGVPITEFTTSCMEITRDDFEVSPTQLNAVITMKENRGKDACSNDKYTLAVCRKDDCFYNKSLETYQKIIRLKTYETLEVRVRNQNSGYSLDFNFTTDEGEPSEVRDFAATSTSDTIEASWKEPLVKNGLIRVYDIEYKHKEYQACSTSSNMASTAVLQTIDTQIKIAGLLPYSKYVITIGASTKYPGQNRTFTVDTKPSSQIALDAYKVDAATFPRRLRLTFSPNCEKIAGPLNFSYVLNCSESWCHNDIKDTVDPQTKTHVIEGLSPYTEYTLYSLYSQNGADLSLSPMTFRTDPDGPYRVRNLDVYEKGEDYLLVRWDAPYPPTGELEKFDVAVTYYTAWGYYDAIRSSSFQRCKIWSDMFCVSVYKLLPKYHHTVIVTAKNKNVNTMSDRELISVVTEVDVPESPINLTAMWSEENELMLKWQHPNRTNGPLRSFNLKINDESKTVDVAEYMLIYEFGYIPSGPFKDTYKVQAVSVNSDYKSKPATITIKSPPPIPSLEAVPSLQEATNHSIKVRLPISQNLASNSSLYIFVSEPLTSTSQNCKPPEVELKDFFEVEGEQCDVWLERQFDLHDVVDLFDLDIGKGSRPLDPGTQYDVYVVLRNLHNDYARKRVYKVKGTTTEGSTVMKMNEGGGSLIYSAFLLLLVPILIYAYLKMKHIRISGFVNPISHRPADSRSDVIPLTKKTETKRVPSKVEEQKVPAKYSKLVNIVDFEEYAKEAIFNGELARQHALFPRGEQKPNDYGKLPQNKPKNRYMNLVAYNHSRVKLSKIPGDQYSDYINANYIKGLHSPKAYIATQGPKPATVNDFWRMIWEQNVHHIVMLANVVENGKKKTEKYWPNYDETEDYGGVSVKHVSSEIYADFEYRSFAVRFGDNERKVEQVHFTTWPDHGVPLYPQSLVPFLRKILTFSHEDSPIVVHCSAGVGRTGTIILIDLSLRMAKEKGAVDLLHHLHQLREQRANMVDNLEQYKLAHLALVECLLAPDTSIPCNEQFETAVAIVVDSDVQKQMDYIANSSWQEDAISTMTSKLLNNQAEKNRFEDIVPESYGIMYLPQYPVGNEGSTYINAVAVDGFHSPKRYVATQQPMPGTLGDFWRLVVEEEVSVVVCLQDVDRSDASCCEFWPTKKLKKLTPTPLITLTHTSTETTEHCTVFGLSLSHKDEQRRINVVALKGWPFGEETPKDVRSLLMLWQQINKIVWNENKIITTCRNGATGCGLYLAMCFILEKIKLEQICDVCQAVRVIRRSRRQFVQSEEQFVTLYELAKLYLCEFELYSNFSSK